jgi:hypothetical protein
MSIFRFVRRFTFIALAGFALSPAAAEETSWLRSALESISAAELDSHVTTLADDSMEGRRPGTAGGQAAGAYLMRELANRGLVAAGDEDRTTFFQEFGRGYRNVLGLWEGSDPELKSQVVVVGAHYDHVGYGSRRTSRGGIGRVHNGADDNASGTAAVLEAVDAIVQLPVRPKRSILFALWDGEEFGLLGSKHWVSHPTVPIHNVAFAINLDMVGRLREDRLRVIGSRSTLGLRQLVSRQNAELNLHLEFPWKIRARSDHSPFYDYGIPVLMFHTGLHDDYHTPRDDAELLNPEGMQKVTQLLFNVAWELADRTERPAFRIASHRETNAARERLEQSSAPTPSPRLGIWWDDSEEERQRDGLLLTKVVAQSAAEKAGLKAGDRIVRFDGKHVRDEEAFRTAVVVASNPVRVLVKREDNPEPVEIDVQLAGKPVRVGIAWREDRAEPGAVFLVQVIPWSPAERAGLKVGDRVYEIAGRTFDDSEEFQSLMNTLPGPIEFLIERDGRLMKIEVPVEPRGGMARVESAAVRRSY